MSIVLESVERLVDTLDKSEPLSLDDFELNQVRLKAESIYVNYLTLINWDCDIRKEETEKALDALEYVRNFFFDSKYYRNIIEERMQSLARLAVTNGFVIPERFEEYLLRDVHSTFKSRT